MDNTIFGQHNFGWHRRTENSTRIKAPKTGVKDNLLSNVLGPAAILGVYLVCLGTENGQKPSDAFFGGPEFIFVEKSI